MLQNFPPSSRLMVGELWPGGGHHIMASWWHGRGCHQAWWPLRLRADHTSASWHCTSAWVITLVSPVTQHHHTLHSSLALRCLSPQSKVSPRNIRQQFSGPLLSDRAGNYKMLSILWHSILHYSCIHALVRKTISSFMIHFHYNLQLVETLLSRPDYLFVLCDLRGVAPCAVHCSPPRVGATWWAPVSLELTFRHSFSFNCTSQPKWIKHKP